MEREKVVSQLPEMCFYFYWAPLQGKTTPADNDGVTPTGWKEEDIRSGADSLRLGLLISLCVPTPARLVVRRLTHLCVVNPAFTSA